MLYVLMLRFSCYLLEKLIKDGFSMAKEILSTGTVWNNFLDIIDLYGGNRDNIEKMLSKDSVKGNISK